jgi:GntR family transcriptional regulator/MocR family aminotransferase
MDDLLPGMLHLARDGTGTLMRQLTDQLRLLITGGRLAPGQRLPSSRHLAEALRLSRNTVSFAIEQLAAEGYVSLSAGRRPQVAEGLSLDGAKGSSKGGRAATAVVTGARTTAGKLAAGLRHQAAAVPTRACRRTGVSA